MEARRRVKHIISLDGTWKYTLRDGAFQGAKAADGAWKTMRLPSSWALNGKKSFDKRQALSYAGTAWFRRRFRVPAEWAGREAALRFEGVDYSCEVFLNGRRVAAHEGFFSPFFALVGKNLRCGENTLAVRVTSPLEKGWGHFMDKTVVKGVLAHHDMRPGGEGPRGQEFGTGGIWGRVSLESFDRLWIERLNAEGFPSGRGARLEVRAHVVNAGRAVRAEAVVTAEGANFNSPRRVIAVRPVKLAAGEGRLRLTLRLPSPRLWEVWERGFPHLYRLRLELRIPGMAPVRASTRFGVRSVKMDREYRFWLNGRRLFLRGTNYIPTQWLSGMDPARARRDCRQMRAHNVNCVRVHAHVTRSRFYDEADAAGLLIWQDFPLQWAYHDSPHFLRTTSEQMKEMLCLLRGHPSIFAWCCHNETPWVHGMDRPQLRGVNLRVDRTLQRLATTRDPDRYTHLNSATGDQHVYYGWYRGNYRQYARWKGRSLVTEYGAQALPGMDSLRRMFGHAPRLPRTREEALEWQFHCFQPVQTFVVAGVPRGNNAREFIENSQGYQARLLWFATSHFRRLKWTKITGLMQFCWCDPWPEIAWSVVDYWRRPKPGAAVLQTVFQPVFPCLIVPHAHLEGGAPSADFRAEVSVVNDLPRCIPDARLRWELRGSGRAIIHGSRRLKIPADSAVPVASFGGPAGLSGSFRVSAVITAKGRILGRNSAMVSFKP